MDRTLRFTCIALFALLCSPAAGQSPERQDVKISLGWTFIATQAVFVYGAEKGYFKSEGINVAVDRGAGSGAAVQRVASGTYDFGYADVGTLIKYNAENRKRMLTAVYIAEDDSPLALFALAGKGIGKPKDIEGKRMGGSQFDGARQMFPVFAKVNQLDTRGINWKTVDPQLREALLARGEVDAITGFTYTSVPLLTNLKQKFTVIRYRDFGVDGFGQALVAAPEFIEKNPNTVRAVVRGLNRSLKAMIENPAEAIASLRTRDAVVDVETELGRLDLLVKDLILTEHVTRAGLSNPEPKRLARMIDQVLQISESTEPLAANVVYTDRFLPPLTERKAPAYRR